jgi:hypothetical protein
MKRVLLLIPLLAACGNDGNPALSKSFNYGAPQQPSTAEQSAGNSAQSSVTTTASFSSSPTADNGASIAAAALDIAGSALGDAAIGMANPQAVRGALIQAANAGFDTCATVVSGKVTFNNCVQTEQGFSVTLNGSITATAGHVVWAITAGFSGTSNGETINIAMNHTGDITVTDTTIKGNAASEFSGSVSAGGQSASFGFAVAVLFDLTYQTAPTACVTSGTVEVRRVWTAKPQGASGSIFDDMGVKLIWNGCGTFQVAHST